MNGYPLRGMLILSRFDRDLAPTANYATTKVVGTDTIDGHEVYIVRGTFKDPSYTERLFFDRQSGLLLRRVTFQRTLFGFLQDISNYSDYRDVQGVKMPFTILRSRPGQALRVKFDKIEFNSPIDNSKFTRPASGQ
jgi:outer membrane lipoprotein-sorting protein